MASVERKTRLELATPTLARGRALPTELFPHLMQNPLQILLKNAHFFEWDCKDMSIL